MKKIIIIALLGLLALPMHAQQKDVKPAKSTTGKETGKTHVMNAGEKIKIYDEETDPMNQIEEALDLARSTDRLVICQVGGNWCPWCIRFANFIDSDMEIKDLVEKHFVYIHVNTSKEHKNPDVLKRLGNPGRFGYPVLVILNHEGNVIHIQNSAYLEQGKGYDQKKVKEFFQNWTLKAINADIK